jgi:tetratricopeptide (TPR) repeat protein
LNCIKSILKKVGKSLREVREEKGMTLDQAAKISGLSKKMCWNLEQGVNSTKIENYEVYAGALGLVFDDLVNQIRGFDPVADQLEWIETEIELFRERDVSETIERLDKLGLQGSYLQTAEYLKGKAFFYSRKYEKSERHLNRAIDLAYKDIEEHGHLNILTCAYNVLANIYYHHYHDPKKALDLANEAISLFVEGGERQTEYYIAHLNRSVFLEKLNRWAESERYASFLWANLSQIRKADTQAAVCEHVGRVRMNNFEIKEAKEAIRLGLDIARRNNLPARASDLALAAGDMYLIQSEEHLAERCYRQALVFAPTVRAHNRLGDFHLKQKEFAQAADHFQKALEMEGCRSEHIDALIGLGKACLLQGKRSEAIPHLKKAEDLAEDMREKIHEISALLATAFEGIDAENRIHYLEKANQIHMMEVLA